MERRPFRRVAAAVIAGLLLLAACTSDDPDPAPTEEGHSGGRLMVGLIVDEFGSSGCTFLFCGPFASDLQIAGLGPVQFELGRCCLNRSLLSYNGLPTAEGGGVVRPDLAADLPDVSADGLTWTFKIKPGLHYAPPLEDVTIQSADFIRSIERSMSPRPVQVDPGAGPLLDGYTTGFLALVDLISGAQDYADGKTEHVSGLSAPDPSTLVVHLTKPVGHLGSILSQLDMSPIPPNPDDPDARFGVAEGLAPFYFSYMVATGPYMIEGANELEYSADGGLPPLPSGAAGDHLLLVRNPSWDPTGDDLRVAAADEIMLVPIESEEEGTKLVKQGALDVVINSNPHPDLLGEDAAGNGTQSFEAPRDWMIFLMLNLAVQPLDDVHVRRAMNFAVAREQLPEIWEKEGLIADVATHLGLDSEEDNLLLNFDPYEAAEGNLSEARKEMALSAYDKNKDGRCDGKHCDVEILVREDKPELVAAARNVDRQLRAIGLRVNSAPSDLDTFFSSYSNPEAHTVIRMDQWVKDLSSGATYFPPLFGTNKTGLSRVSSDTLLGSTPAQLERWGYKVRKVPNVDDRIETCATLTFTAQTQCWADLDSYLMTQVVPWVPLLKLQTGWVTSARVTDFAVDQSPSNPLPALDRIAIDPSVEAPPLPDDDQPVPDIPEGTYRVTITKQDFEKLSSPADPEGLQENTGTTFITMRDGDFVLMSTADHPLGSPITVGDYGGTGDHVNFRYLRPLHNKLDLPSMQWSFDGEELTFKWENCGNLNELEPHLCDFIRVFFEAHPWEKVY